MEIGPGASLDFSIIDLFYFLQKGTTYFLPLPICIWKFFHKVKYQFWSGFFNTLNNEVGMSRCSGLPIALLWINRFLAKCIAFKLSTLWQHWSDVLLLETVCSNVHLKPFTMSSKKCTPYLKRFSCGNQKHAFLFASPCRIRNPLSQLLVSDEQSLNSKKIIWAEQLSFHNGQLCIMTSLLHCRSIGLKFNHAWNLAGMPATII